MGHPWVTEDGAQGAIEKYRKGSNLFTFAHTVILIRLGIY